MAGFRWSAALKPALRRSPFFEEVLSSGEGDGEAVGSRPSHLTASMSMLEVSSCRVSSSHHQSCRLSTGLGNARFQCGRCEDIRRM